jgi:hypothetical protein
MRMVLLLGTMLSLADGTNQTAQFVPKSAGPPSSKECARAEAQVESGLALEDDFNRALVCVLDRLSDDNEASRFMEKVQAANLKPVQVACLPADLKSQLPSSATGLEVRVYTTGSGASRLKGICPKLKAGTYRSTGISLGGGNRGHSDATRKAAQIAGGLSPDAIDILADASQDPDFFQWTVMPAHAQTEDKAGVPNQTEAQAQEATVKWVGKMVHKASDLCKQDDPPSLRLAVYWLGYSLHALEDLAAHRGRTNPEHSFNSKVDLKDPDERPNAFELASDIAATFLDRTLRGPLAGCRTRLATLKAGSISWWTKTSSLGLHRDLSRATEKAYEDSWTMFQAVQAKPGVRVRWFGGLHEGPRTCGEDPKCQALLDRFLAFAK